ncbi:MAG: hypothetical protein JNK78_00130 [Planctomycetes bacterium]|nr:hypothetical protein [Planctomycetota bacterium]
MNFRPGTLPAFAFAALLALPGLSTDGGGNASGTGVWILPRPTYVSSGCATVGVVANGAGIGSTAAVGCFAIASLGSDVHLVTSSDLSSFTAAMIDSVSGVAIPLVVSGREVVISKDQLQGLAASGVSITDVVVADSGQLGYVLRVQIDAATGSATLTLR